jgi:type II secretory pathway component PulK
MRDPKGQDGVAVLLVMVILVMTITSVYAFARSSLLDVLGMKHRTHLARARLLADSGVQIARRAILDDLLMEHDPPRGQYETDMDAWALLSRSPISAPGGGELRITILDAGSRINLNGLVDAQGKAYPESEAFLKGLLEKMIDDLPGRQEDKFYDVEELARARLDWIDGDEATALGGDEAREWATQGATGEPPNRPLFAIEELGAIPGVDPLLLEGIEAYFTIYPSIPETAGVNPNTAPPHVLAVLYNVTREEFPEDEDVFAILRARREELLFCPAEGPEGCTTLQSEAEAFVGRGEILFPPPQFESDVFTVRSEGRYGKARARITAVLDRSEPEELRILAYRVE